MGGIYKGNKTINIKPNDTNISFRFKHDVQTSQDDVEAIIEYGDSLSSATSYITDSSGATVSGIISDTAVLDNDVIVTMSYPSGLVAAGTYSLTNILTTVKPSTIEMDFPNRIIIE